LHDKDVEAAKRGSQGNQNASIRIEKNRSPAEIKDERAPDSGNKSREDGGGNDALRAGRGRARQGEGAQRNKEDVRAPSFSRIAGSMLLLISDSRAPDELAALMSSSYRLEAHVTATKVQSPRGRGLAIPDAARRVPQSSTGRRTMGNAEIGGSRRVDTVWYQGRARLEERGETGSG
jgi:hypothetical protein